MVRVTDANFEEVDSFTMGIRVFYNEQQVNAIPPTTIEDAHWDIDYVWKKPGNHIVYIDLYDMDGTEGTLTYSFNMGTQSPFGIIFIVAITIGALTFAILIGYIYLPKIFKKLAIVLSKLFFGYHAWFNSIVFLKEESNENKKEIKKLIYLKLSKYRRVFNRQTTLLSLLRNSSHKFDPIKPAPPVTKIVLLLNSIFI